jgi:hypothetical protein
VEEDCEKSPVAVLQEGNALRHAWRLQDTLVCGAAIIICIIDISTSQYNLYISDKQIGNSQAARDAVSACCYYDNGIILICLCVPKRHGGTAQCFLTRPVAR